MAKDTPSEIAKLSYALRQKPLQQEGEEIGERVEPTVEAYVFVA
jgi:hypothetical protein